MPAHPSRKGISFLDIRIKEKDFIHLAHARKNVSLRFVRLIGLCQELELSNSPSVGS